MVQRVVDQLFSFGELGFQEIETSRYLVDVLRREGFTVDTGVAGMPTAWVARWGRAAGDRAGLRHRRHPPGFAGARASPAGCRWSPARRGTARDTTRGRRSTSRPRSRSSGSWSGSSSPARIVLWPGVAEEQLGGKPFLVRAGRLQGRRRRALQPRGHRVRHLVGRDLGHRAGLGALPVRGHRGACRRARPGGAERAGRGGADGHRLELPPRAPAAEAALPFRHRRWRRPAQRRPSERFDRGTTCASWTTRGSRRSGRSPTRSPRARP